MLAIDFRLKNELLNVIVITDDGVKEGHSAIERLLSYQPLELDKAHHF